MKKTPDEIKKGLEVCNIWMVDEPTRCMECPYFCTKDCADTLMKHSLALIQQLQAENAEKDARIHQLEAERDVYREGLKTEVGCYGCKHYVDDPDYDSNECMSCGKNMCNFEWRGVQKEETP